MDTAMLDALVPIVAIFMGCLIVLVPVAGFTARFAIKPITESIAKMREGSTNVREVAVLEQRVALLEQQVQHMETAVERIGTAKEFDRQLSSGPKH